MPSDLERFRPTSGLARVPAQHDRRLARMQDAANETLAEMAAARKVAAASRAAQHSATARFLRNRFFSS